MADGIIKPELTGYSSYVNTNAGLYLSLRHSWMLSPKPQIQAAHPFEPPISHMAMIPVMEAVMSHPCVATGDHGATDFAIPEHINISYSFTNNTPYHAFPF